MKHLITKDTLTCVTSGINVCSIDFVRISKDILESFRPRLECLDVAIAELQPRFETYVKVAATKFQNVILPFHTQYIGSEIIICLDAFLLFCL